MNTTETGRLAEAATAVYLAQRGYKVVARNWRTRWTEVDLVAVDRRGVVRLVEVKYRRSEEHGTGFEYITPRKVQHLKRAAAIWEATHRQHCQIDVVAVTGSLDSPEIQHLENAVEG